MKKIISSLVILVFLFLPVTSATETYGLSAADANLYLQALEPLESQHNYVYSRLLDFTGDGSPELYVAYGTKASDAKECVWTIKNGNLVELSDSAKYVGASYLGVGQDGKGYILYELTADSSVSGGMFYRIVGYENDSFGLVYELIRSDTYAFDPDTLYDYSSPISYYSENGVHEDELPFSGRELYENMVAKYGFSSEKEYTRGDDFGGSLPSSGNSNVNEILSELSTAVVKPDIPVEIPVDTENTAETEADSTVFSHSEAYLRYAELKAGLPYNGDDEIKLSEAQILAFIGVLEENDSYYQTLLAEREEIATNYYLWEGDEKQSLRKEIYVAFFDIGDGVVGMMVEDILYLWTPSDGILTHSIDEFSDYQGEVSFYSFGEGGSVNFSTRVTGGGYYVGVFDVTIHQGRLYRTEVDTYFWGERPNENFNEFLQKQVIRGSGVDLGLDILSYGTIIPNNLLILQVDNGEIVENVTWDMTREVRLSFLQDMGYVNFRGNIQTYQEVLLTFYSMLGSVEEYFGFPTAEEEVEEAVKTLIPRTKKVFHLKKELYYAVVEEEQGDQGAVITYLDGKCDFYEEIAPLKTQAELVTLSQNFLSLSDLDVVEEHDSASVDSQQIVADTEATEKNESNSPLTTVLITVLILALVLVFVMALSGVLFRKKN